MQRRCLFHHGGMKKFYLAFLFSFAVFMIHAQPAKDKIYGFQQRVSPGAKAAGDIDENGRLIKKKSREVFHYTIYLTTVSKARIYPVQMWINGEAFSVKSKAVAQLPAVQTNIDAPAAKVKPLIPETAGEIIKLTPMPLTVDKGSVKAKALARQNAVLVLYKKEGKLHYGVLKKFTGLAPLSLQ